MLCVETATDKEGFLFCLLSALIYCLPADETLLCSLQKLTAALCASSSSFFISFISVFSSSYRKTVINSLFDFLFQICSIKLHHMLPLFLLQHLSFTCAKINVFLFILIHQQKLSLRSYSSTGLLQLCSLIVSRRTKYFLSSQLSVAV